MRTGVCVALGLAFIVARAPRPVWAAAPSPRSAPSAAECVKCHPGEAEAWSRSPHARSRTNPLFVASFGHSHLRWCLDCHAPRVDAVGPRAAGIDCASCHLSHGVVLTTRVPTASGLRAHAMQQAASLKTVEACERCHQFAAPEAMTTPLHFTAVPMQDTVMEWTHSKPAAAGVTCQGCHMARGNHDIEGGHDVELLRKTVSMVFDAVDGGYSATLRVQGAGHGVPTGDPFRRFELEIRSPDAGELYATRRFGRSLWQLPDAGWEVRNTAAPTPLGRDSSSPALSFAVPTGGFTWALTYRMDEPGLDSEVASGDYALDVAAGRVTAR